MNIDSLSRTLSYTSISEPEKPTKSVSAPSEEHLYPQVASVSQAVDTIPQPPEMTSSCTVGMTPPQVRQIPVESNETKEANSIARRLIDSIFHANKRENELLMSIPELMLIEGAIYENKHGDDLSMSIREQMSQEQIDRVSELDLCCLSPRDRKITPDQLTQLATTFPNITDVNLKNPNYSNEHLLALACFKNLRNLYLVNGAESTYDFFDHKVSLTDQQIEPLGKLKTLTRLILAGHESLTGKTFGKLPASLELLYVNRCNLTEESIGNMHHLMNIQQLSLEDNRSLSGKELGQLPISLTVLKMSGCKVTDDCLLNLQHLTHLHTLDLSHNADITGKNFSKLPTSLLYLSVGNCSVTDDSICNLEQHHELKTLALDGNKLLTGNTFDKLPTSLSDVYLSRCSSLVNNVFIAMSHLVQLQCTLLPSHFMNVSHQLRGSVTVIPY